MKIIDVAVEGITESRARALYSARLLAETRYRIAAGRRLLNSAFAFAGSSDDEHAFACTHCGTSHSPAEDFVAMHAGRTVTRWCIQCQRLFDIDIPAQTIPPSPQP